MRLTKRMLRLSTLALVAWSMAAASTAQTVVLVRHAEKAAEPAADPPLTPAGRERATALASALSGARVTHVFTSPTRRTRDTAAPVAASRSITPVEVPIARGGPAHAAEIAALIGKLPRNAVVLVAGHSNTVPLIADALGSTTRVELPECAFDRMVVMVLDGASADTVKTRYGSVSADCPG